MTDKKHRKLIDATELIQQLSVDPVKCPGCPEPEFLPELIDVLEAAPAVDVYGMNGWCKEIPGGDLISRTAAIDDLHGKDPSQIWDTADIEVWVNALPSAQPEIIRCKDCKHSEHWYRDKSRCFLWHEEGIDIFEDGFCNYAERRTDEQT